MRRALIVAIKRCLRLALRNRQIGRSRIVDESNLPPAEIDRLQQLQPNLNNYESVSLITCMSAPLACFSGRRQDLSQSDTTEEAPDNCNNLRSVRFAAADPTTSTADRNYMMLHASMQYAIFI